MFEWIMGIVAGAVAMHLFHEFRPSAVAANGPTTKPPKRPEPPPTREELDELRKRVKLFESGVQSCEQSLEFAYENGSTDLVIAKTQERLASAKRRLKDAQEKLNRRTAEYEAHMLEKGHD